MSPNAVPFSGFTPQTRSGYEQSYPSNAQKQEGAIVFSANRQDGVTAKQKISPLESLISRYRKKGGNVKKKLSGKVLARPSIQTTGVNQGQDETWRTMYTSTWLDNTVKVEESSPSQVPAGRGKIVSRGSTSSASARSGDPGSVTNSGGASSHRDAMNLRKGKAVSPSYSFVFQGAPFGDRFPTDPSSSGAPEASTSRCSPTEQGTFRVADVGASASAPKQKNGTGLLQRSNSVPGDIHEKYRKSPQGSQSIYSGLSDLSSTVEYSPSGSLGGLTPRVRLQQARISAGSSDMGSDRIGPSGMHLQPVVGRPVLGVHAEPGPEFTVEEAIDFSQGGLVFGVPTFEIAALRPVVLRHGTLVALVANGRRMAAVPASGRWELGPLAASSWASTGDDSHAGNVTLTDISRWPAECLFILLCTGDGRIGLRSIAAEGRTLTSSDSGSCFSSWQWGEGEQWWARPLHEEGPGGWNAEEGGVMEGAVLLANCLHPRKRQVVQMWGLTAKSQSAWRKTEEDAMAAKLLQGQVRALRQKARQTEQQAAQEAPQGVSPQELHRAACTIAELRAQVEFLDSELHKTTAAAAVAAQARAEGPSGRMQHEGRRGGRDKAAAAQEELPERLFCAEAEARELRDRVQHLESVQAEAHLLRCQLASAYQKEVQGQHGFTSPRLWERGNSAEAADLEAYAAAAQQDPQGHLRRSPRGRAYSRGAQFQPAPPSPAEEDRPSDPLFYSGSGRRSALERARSSSRERAARPRSRETPFWPSAPGGEEARAPPGGAGWGRENASEKLDGAAGGALAAEEDGTEYWTSLDTRGNPIRSASPGRRAAAAGGAARRSPSPGGARGAQAEMSSGSGSGSGSSTRNGAAAASRRLPGVSIVDGEEAPLMRRPFKPAAVAVAAGAVPGAWAGGSGTDVLPPPPANTTMWAPEQQHLGEGVLRSQPPAPGTGRTQPQASPAAAAHVSLGHNAPAGAQEPPLVHAQEVGPRGPSRMLQPSLSVSSSESTESSLSGREPDASRDMPATDLPQPRVLGGTANSVQPGGHAAVKNAQAEAPALLAAAAGSDAEEQAQDGESAAEHTVEELTCQERPRFRPRWASGVARSAPAPLQAETSSSSWGGSLNGPGDSEHLVGKRKVLEGRVSASMSTSVSMSPKAGGSLPGSEKGLQGGSSGQAPSSSRPLLLGEGSRGIMPGGRQALAGAGDGYSSEVVTAAAQGATALLSEHVLAEEQQSRTRGPAARQGRRIAAAAEAAPVSAGNAGFARRGMSPSRVVEKKPRSQSPWKAPPPRGNGSGLSELTRVGSRNAEQVDGPFAPAAMGGKSDSGGSVSAMGALFADSVIDTGSGSERRFFATATGEGAGLAGEACTSYAWGEGSALLLYSEHGGSLGGVSKGQPSRSGAPSGSSLWEGASAAEDVSMPVEAAQVATARQAEPVTAGSEGGIGVHGPSLKNRVSALRERISALKGELSASKEGASAARRAASPARVPPPSADELRSDPGTYTRGGASASATGRTDLAGIGAAAAAQPGVPGDFRDNSSRLNLSTRPRVSLSAQQGTALLEIDAGTGGVSTRPPPLSLRAGARNSFPLPWQQQSQDRSTMATARGASGLSEQVAVGERGRQPRSDCTEPPVSKNRPASPARGAGISVRTPSPRKVPPGGHSITEGSEESCQELFPSTSAPLSKLPGASMDVPAKTKMFAPGIVQDKENAEVLRATSEQAAPDRRRPLHDIGAPRGRSHGR
eukprot:jgi/Mesen1/8994/ME000056S08402